MTSHQISDSLVCSTAAWLSFQRCHRELQPAQRDTEVKRKFAIDCGQKGFWSISYCLCASSIDLKGEINVLQDCFCLFIYLLSYGESCKWIWREESIFWELWLCCKQTQSSSRWRKRRPRASLQIYFHCKIQKTGLVGLCLLQKNQ